MIIVPCPLPVFYIVLSNKQIGANHNMKQKLDELKRA